MLPARRYWSRFLLHLLVGFLFGFVVGSIVQALSEVPGWGVLGATAGVVAGVALFMLRDDT